MLTAGAAALVVLWCAENTTSRSVSSSNGLFSRALSGGAGRSLCVHDLSPSVPPWCEHCVEVSAAHGRMVVFFCAVLFVEAAPALGEDLSRPLTVMAVAPRVWLLYVVP